MRATIALVVLVLAALLLPAEGAFGRGGGGGGGGGGRGAGGGGGGSRGGMSGGGGAQMNHGGNVGGGNVGGTHTNGGQNKSSFTNKNFNNGAVNHQVNRLNTGGQLGNNAFVRNQNIAHASQNHFNGNWNNWNHRWGGGNSFFFNPWWGYGGFGLWGLGFGSPYYSYGGGYSGYGSSAYSYVDDAGYGNSDLAYADSAEQATDAPVDSTLTADGPNGPDGKGPSGDPESAAKFIDQGEIDFKAGRYAAAARDWQHALVDDPRNGGVMMLMAQTLFAMGQYEDSAGATQAAMQLLPPDKWNVVVANYAQLYGNPQDYTDQLKALEKARDAKPNSPALHFLLGFHFGYLNYAKNAVKELDKTLTLAPKDLGARKLRDVFAAKWPEAPPLPQAAVDAAEAAAKAGGARPPVGGGRPPGGPPAGAKPFKPPGPSGDN